MSNADAIQISVTTQYIEQQSQPDHKRFVFSYTITIKNCGDTTTQLLSRHWIIKDANDTVQEVFGDGVVGEQPHIQPGAEYTYSSGAILETNVGTMEGSYTMRLNSGTVFDAPIPTFSLTRPQALH